MDIVYINIKKRRQELGISQRELARKCGYKDNTTIAKMEKGLVDLPLGRLKQIALALDTSVFELMGYNDQPDK